MKPSMAAFCDELSHILPLEKRAEGDDSLSPDEPLPRQAPSGAYEFARYGLAEPLARVGIPAALGTGAGYLAGGGLYHALRSTPHVGPWFQSLPHQNVVSGGLKAAVGLGGMLTGLGLAWKRHQLYNEIERAQMEQREQEQPSEG
jgi:hypothetical protein